MDIEKYLDKNIKNKFEFYNYGHALEILHDAFPTEWRELQDCLSQLQLTLDDIKKEGGNESPIPKKFDDVLYPYGWREIRISGDLTDGGPDGRGVGFYFRNVTELLLFGIKKKSAPNRTLSPARSQVNLIRSIKREHSRKPDEMIPIIEACSQGPRIELFARGIRDGWDMWGNQASADYEPTWDTYANHTVMQVQNRMA